MTDIPPRWYCVDRHGLATLCADEANAREEAAVSDIAWPHNAPHTAVQLAPVPAQPTIAPEQARDSQQWAGMDGAVAWHLIDRHADGWADVGVMMDAWLEANRAPVPAQGAEGVEALAVQIAGWACEARNEWAEKHEAAWLEETCDVHPDTFVGEYIARRLRNSSEIPNSSFSDSARLDFIERMFSGVTNRERYLPVTMIWGKGCNGRTLREACDKYMARDAARSAGGDDA